MRVRHPIRPGAFILGFHREETGGGKECWCFFWHVFCGSIWFFFLRNVHTFHTLPKFFISFLMFLEVSSYISVLKLRQKMKHPRNVGLFETRNDAVEYEFRFHMGWFSTWKCWFSWMSPLSSWYPHWVHSVPRSSRVVALSRPPWIRVQQVVNAMFVFPFFQEISRWTYSSCIRQIYNVECGI